MLGHLNLLCYNLGKRKQVQWSLMNDEKLQEYQEILQVEPYIYEDPQTHIPAVGSHRQWQQLTPSIRREDGHIRHSFRAMIWINETTTFTAIAIQSYDIAAAVINPTSLPTLLVAAYDPHGSDTTTRKESEEQY